MQKKGVYKLSRKADVPEGEKIYPSITNWLNKKVVGVYDKTKCRIYFGGHLYNKSFNSELPISIDFTVFRSNVRLVHWIDRLFTCVFERRP